MSGWVGCFVGWWLGVWVGGLFCWLVARCVGGWVVLLAGG